jgi:hypothetical protein
MGAHAKAIQKLAVHADLSTTLRYMHLSREIGGVTDGFRTRDNWSHNLAVNREIGR